MSTKKSTVHCCIRIIFLKVQAGARYVLFKLFWIKICLFACSSKALKSWLGLHDLLHIASDDRCPPLIVSCVPLCAEPTTHGVSSSKPIVKSLQRKHETERRGPIWHLCAKFSGLNTDSEITNKY